MVRELAAFSRRESELAMFSRRAWTCACHASDSVERILLSDIYSKFEFIRTIGHEMEPYRAAATAFGSGLLEIAGDNPVSALALL